MASSDSRLVHDLDRALRRVPDFPKPGILFYDITSVLTDSAIFGRVIDAFAERCTSLGIDSLAAVESRGFLFAAPLALRLGLPLILVRKKGKLPGKTASKAYALEYGSAEIEVHVDDVKPGARFAIIDDLIATGGTIEAAASLLAGLGAKPEAVLAVVGLPFLGYEKLLAGKVASHTLIDFDSE